jgi:hypothetical protein
MRRAQYESQMKPSGPVQRPSSEYNTLTPTSNKSAVVRLDPSDWQSRLAVNVVDSNHGAGGIPRRAADPSAAAAYAESAGPLKKRIELLMLGPRSDTNISNHCVRFFLAA